MTVALTYRIKARARREIVKAAAWWGENRLAAPGAIRKDVLSRLGPIGGLGSSLA